MCPGWASPGPPWAGPAVGGSSGSMYACVGGAGAVATMSCYYPHDPLLFTPIDTGRIGPECDHYVSMLLCSGRLPSFPPGKVRSHASQNQITAGSDKQRKVAAPSAPPCTGSTSLLAPRDGRLLRRAGSPSHGRVQHGTCSTTRFLQRQRPPRCRNRPAPAWLWSAEP